MALDLEYEKIFMHTKVGDVPNITQVNTEKDINNLKYLDDTIGNIGAILHDINSGTGGQGVEEIEG